MIHCYPWTLWVNVLQFQSSCNMSKKNKQAPLPKCQPDKNFSPYAVTSKARLPSKVLNGIQRDDRASFTLFLVCLSWEPQTTFLQSWGLADLSHTLREREREKPRERNREREVEKETLLRHIWAWKSHTPQSISAARHLFVALKGSTVGPRGNMTITAVLRWWTLI